MIKLLGCLTLLQTLQTATIKAYTSEETKSLVILVVLEVTFLHVLARLFLYFCSCLWPVCQ